MLSPMFPPVIDNTYRGQRAGYWLLAPVLFVKIANGESELIPKRGIEGKNFRRLIGEEARLRIFVWFCGADNWRKLEEIADKHHLHPAEGLLAAPQAPACRFRRLER